MALSKESADALRECVRILAAKYRDSSQRATMARNAEQYVQKGEWFPAFAIADIPDLFYPEDPDRAQSMREQISAAIASGEIAFMPQSTRDRLNPSELSAWVDCPRVPKRSPLRFWLPAFMHEVDSARAPSESEASQAQPTGRMPSSVGGKAARQARSVDWSEWEHARDVKLWEAVALSLDIEPTKVRFAEQGWMAGPGHVITEEGEEFDKRLRIASRALNHELDVALPREGDPGRSSVLVKHFATWAAVIGWEMPKEMRRLAAEGVDADTMAKPLSQWCDAELWSLREAAYLLSGDAPRDEREFRTMDRDAGGAVGLTYRDLKNSTIAGTLDFRDFGGTVDRRRVRPGDAVAWAIKRGSTIPDALRTLVAADPQAATARTAWGYAMSPLAPVPEREPEHTAQEAAIRAAWGYAAPEAELDPAALREQVRFWLKHDTWTTREGLLLLVGIEPRGASVKGAKLSATELELSNVATLGSKYPTVGKFVAPEAATALLQLRAWWYSDPLRAASDRHAPQVFLDFAQAKGHAVPWLDVAREAALLESADDQGAAEAHSDAAGGARVRWTPELIAEARAHRDRLKQAGIKDYAAKTAETYGVSPQRLRELLRDERREPAAALNWPPVSGSRTRNR